MSFKESFSKFIKDCKRVLKVAKKPDADEYTKIAKITAAGILLIGAIGFVFSFVSQLLGV